MSHPVQERLASHHQGLRPLLVSQKLRCGFFYIPQKQDKWKCCETGPTVFRPDLTRLEGLTICRCHDCKGSIFSSVQFKDPECWSSQGLILRPPTQQNSTLPPELTMQFGSLGSLQVSKFQFLGRMQFLLRVLTRFLFLNRILSRIFILTGILQDPVIGFLPLWYDLSYCISWSYSGILILFI